jgi:HD superfamily phosphohydrolase
VLDKEELRIVCAMITGEVLQDYPPFLFEIVANKKSGLDTDKMDYLQRDAYHIGKSVISIDSIVKNVKIDEDYHVRYCVKTKANILALFNTRMNMYKTVYFHKTVAKIDKMMICALMQIDFNLDDVEAYVNYDDSFVEYTIRCVLRHDVVHCLDNRELEHKCSRCPVGRLARVAKLSRESDDPMSRILFYD